MVLPVHLKDFSLLKKYLKNWLVHFADHQIIYFIYSGPDAVDRWRKLNKESFVQSFYSFQVVSILFWIWCRTRPGAFNFHSLLHISLSLPLTSYLLLLLLLLPHWIFVYKKIKHLAENLLKRSHQPWNFSYLCTW